MLKKSLLLNIGADHITIPEEQFSLGFLPPVEATDFLSYLVLETFFYTKQQFKAYKKLTISKCLGLQRLSKIALCSESTL